MDYETAYSELHKNHKRFPGYSICAYVDKLTEIISARKPDSLLDYGCGKGFQYLSRRIHERWGGPLPYCYDIGVSQLRGRPARKFDGVICTDVLEHIENVDLESVIRDILSFTNESAFAFFSISCVPSRNKELSDGRNVHLTVRPPGWWQDLLDGFKRPNLEIHAVFDERS